jgi:hypothetical protein
LTEDLQQLIEDQLAALEQRRQELLKIRDALQAEPASKEKPRPAIKETPTDQNQEGPAPPRSKQAERAGSAQRDPGASAAPKSEFAKGHTVSRFQEPVEYRQLSEAEMRKLFLGSSDSGGEQKIIDVIYSLGQATITTLSYYLTATPGVLLPRLEELKSQGILNTEGAMWVPARPGQEITA